MIALRREFRIPDDDERLQVVHDDGARSCTRARAITTCGLVDGYDETGIPEALSTHAFYDDCRAALAPGGAMAGNLYCADHAAHVETPAPQFGDAMWLVLEEQKMRNRVVFAWNWRCVGDGAADIARNAQLRRRR